MWTRSPCHQATLARSWAARPWPAESRPALRRRLRLAEGRGKGPGGPGLTVELDGEVGWAGERPAVADFARRSSVPTGKTATGGGDFCDLWPIPSRGRKRAARRCSSASRRAGERAERRRRTTASSGPCGGLGRERESQEEGKRNGRKRRSSWRPGKSPGAHLGGQSGEQEVATPVSWEPPRTCFSKKTTHNFK
jgi:hypothetical protein